MWSQILKIRIWREEFWGADPFIYSSGEKSPERGNQTGQASFLTTIHFNHLLSGLSPPRSKRKWIFSFPVRGLAAAIQLRGKKELKEREENEAAQTFEVRGHKSLALGARFIWPPGLGGHVLNWMNCPVKLRISKLLENEVPGPQSTEAE